MEFLRRVFEYKGAFITKTQNEIFYASIFMNAFLISFAVGKSENLQNLVLFIANHLKIEAWLLYLFLWSVYGLLAALMYRFGTNGPANPFAKDSTEILIFWIFVVSGPVGYIVSSFIFVRYAHVERKLKKEMIASWAYKPTKPVAKNPKDVGLDDQVRLLM